MAEFASKGVAGTGLGLGAAGTALGLLNGGLGNLLGGLGAGNRCGCNTPCNGPTPCGKSDDGLAAAMSGLMLSSALLGSKAGAAGCNETIGATRYDLGVMERLAAKDAEIARLTLGQEVDAKILALYQVIDARDKATGQEIAKLSAGQAVVNQQLNDNMAFIQNDLNNKIALEAERRCCGDSSIVTYLNTNFQTKAIASFTPSTDAPVPAATFNPIANCGCGCGCGN